MYDIRAVAGIESGARNSIVWPFGAHYRPHNRLAAAVAVTWSLTIEISGLLFGVKSGALFRPQLDTHREVNKRATSTAAASPTQYSACAIRYRELERPLDQRRTELSGMEWNGMNVHRGNIVYRRPQTAHDTRGSVSQPVPLRTAPRASLPPRIDPPARSGSISRLHAS